jgi:hypothetical protein
MQIEGNAPASFFDKFIASYPGQVSYTEGHTASGRLIDRGNDPAPHRGGAAIYGPAQGGTSGCTSGFTVRRTSDAHDYMATAGHCYGNGAAITDEQGASYGTVQWRAVFPTYDTELIGGSTYQGRMYVGSITSGTTHPVVGAGDPVVNSIYCSGGSFSGEHCNHTIQSTSATLCDGDGTSCTSNLMKFTGGLQLLHGDSGGPVYYKNSSLNLSVRGTIVGVVLSSGYATKWSTIRDRFGVTIVLG